VVPAGCLLPPCQGPQLGVTLHPECSAAGRSSSEESQHHALSSVCAVTMNLYKMITMEIPWWICVFPLFSHIYSHIRMGVLCKGKHCRWVIGVSLWRR